MREMLIDVISEVEEDKAVGIGFETAILYDIDLKTGECRAIDIIPREEPQGKKLYSSACKAKNKVYFAPSAAKEIAVYNLESKSVYKISFRKLLADYPGYKKNKVFGEAFALNDYVYMTPYTYPAVLRINVHDDSIEIFDQWKDGSPICIRKCPVFYDNKFYLSSMINNKVLEFDLNSNEGKIHYIGKNNNGCWSIYKDDIFFWLAPAKDGPIVRWDKNANEILELNTFPEEYEGRNFCFSKIYKIDNNLYFIAAGGNMSIRIDLNNNSMAKINIKELNENDFITYLFSIGNYVYLRISKNDTEKTVRLNIKENILENYSFICCESEKTKILNNKIIYGGNIVRETQFLSVEDYILSISETV